VLLLTAAALAVPPESATWTIVASSPVRIRCTTWQGQPYCQSTGVISAPVNQAVATFRELDRYQSRMGAISTIARLEPDVLHIVMDYPFPLDDRDYVARFTYAEREGGHVFAWQPVEHPKAPASTEAVRLTWLEGEWRFAAEGAGTRVTYVWQADPGGSLPDVRAVHVKAGNLAISDMAAACEAKLVSP
jgi:hypothetical protein